VITWGLQKTIYANLQVEFDLESRRHALRQKPKRIGLAIVGAGRVGLFRGEVAARHSAVDWIGIAEKNPDRAREVAAMIRADFVTGDYR
jgi:threonine dehydrogenase-like Zn-dependent dehydrogenase